jgi:hypothetical protein
MNLIEAIKQTVQMEIRPNTEGVKYLEAVVDRKDLEVLHALLRKHLGPPAKESGKEEKFPQEIQRLVDSLGGLRIEQSFFYRKDGDRLFYAALWPWQSDPYKITLKSGVKESPGGMSQHSTK